MDHLIERAKAGDAQALEELLTSVAPSVQRFGQRMCRNEHDAEDILQDALLTIARSINNFEGRSSFSTWVFAVTRSACSRKRRGLKNQPAVPIDLVAEGADESASPEDRVGDAELGRVLQRALDQLSEDYREVIMLRDVEGLTAQEAAEALDISVDALKSRLHRARIALRTALAPALEPKTLDPSPQCPDIMALWSQKLEGDLSSLDCAQMEKHLQSCASCASACDALKKALHVCQRSASRPVDPRIQDRVRAAVRNWLVATGSVPPPR